MAGKVKAKIEKAGMAALEKLDVVYVPIDSVQPNDYNPNRQSEHDFGLLCKSISEDGFTQPIIVQRQTKEIVDGEHRWRACRALGFKEVPVVYTDMSAEQARIATLRHNRARGSEDAALAAEVMREVAGMGDGATDRMKESLQIDDVEMKRLMENVALPESAGIQVESVVDENGKPLVATPGVTGNNDPSDALRIKERMIQQAKLEEDQRMAAEDRRYYRLTLVYSSEEADVVRRALGQLPAQKIVELCRQAAAQK